MILFTLTYIPLLGINWKSTYYLFGKPIYAPIFQEEANHAPKDANDAPYAFGGGCSRP